MSAQKFFFTIFLFWPEIVKFFTTFPQKRESRVCIPRKAPLVAATRS